MKSIVVLAVVIGLIVSTADAAIGGFSVQLGALLLKGATAALMVLGLGIVTRWFLSHSVEKQQEK